ncbi:hypothetical protein CWI38_0128p0080 [Hamiltosporidium tvaerminnensis]|uniref:Pre-rRNA-processing protein TSR2 n=1 Tax=Hamiltosporidium tvaerminnensis TaxID=1176355 RepID=A0A4Q9M0J4_9MICR|nr:hypothetical protein CWI38_0128p0080 [Hamiltosporidium tvaerminnensis]
MNSNVLAEKISVSLRKWTVMKLVKNYIKEESVLDVEKVLLQFFLSLNSKKFKKNEVTEDIAEYLNDFLCKNNVDTEYSSCFNMAVCLVEIYTENIEGKSIIYNEIRSKNEAECENIETSDDSFSESEE